MVRVVEIIEIGEMILMQTGDVGRPGCLSSSQRTRIERSYTRRSCLVHPFWCLMVSLGRVFHLHVSIHCVSRLLLRSVLPRLGHSYLSHTHRDIRILKVLNQHCRISLVLVVFTISCYIHPVTSPESERHSGLPLNWADVMWTVGSRVNSCRP